jgi:hypothetical protein
VPTRHDVHAGTDREAADANLDVRMETTMNKILIASALALVASAPLAFAKTTTPPPAGSLTMEHCTAVERNFDDNRAHYKSESAFLVAEQKAMSQCRWDKHPNDGTSFGAKAR